MARVLEFRRPLAPVVPLRPVMLPEMDVPRELAHYDFPLAPAGSSEADAAWRVEQALSVAWDQQRSPYTVLTVRSIEAVDALDELLDASDDLAQAIQHGPSRLVERLWPVRDDAMRRVIPHVAVAVAEASDIAGEIA